MALDPDSGSLIIQISIIVFCLLLSGLFSGSETAITSFNELKAKHLLEKRGRSAKLLRLWLREPTQVLTTILVGNNLVNILGSAMATSLVLKHFPEGGVVLATAVMTVSILFFSEVIPKTLAKANSEYLVLPALRFVWIFRFILYPAMLLFAWLAERTLSFFGKNGQKWATPSVTEDEISFLIDISEAEGALELEKKQLLENVFEFGNTVVREIMIPRTDMVAISEDTTAGEVVQVMLEKGRSRIPIYRENIDNVTGIIHVKDILRRFRDQKNMDFSVKELSTREPVFVPETKPVNELLMEFRNKKRQMAIVVDEHGGTSGLATFEDLIEEIVGEVRDEYDEQEEDMVLELESNRYLIDARMNFDDFVDSFGDYMEIHGDERDEEEFLDTGDFDTIGGFIAEKLGHIPKTGEEVVIERLKLRVTQVVRRRVRKMELFLTPDPAEGNDKERESSLLDQRQQKAAQ
jgi:putative hemolysin